MDQRNIIFQLGSGFNCFLPLAWPPVPSGSLLALAHLFYRDRRKQEANSEQQEAITKTLFDH